MADASFTILTPTYNRAYTIERVYNSLKVQTYNKFEWLIIDDGSTDNTGECVKKFMSENKIKIKYLKKCNGGKHTAINFGLDHVSSDLVIILDSDDEIINTALFTANLEWEKIRNNPNIVGIKYLSKTNKGLIHGKEFPQRRMVTSNIELTYKYKCSGERFDIYKTEILKEYKFPEIDGIKYISEGVVWHQIGRKYNMLCINECLRIYFLPDKYEGDNLSTLSTNQQILRGTVYSFLWWVNNDFDYFKGNKLKFLKMYIIACRVNLHLNKKINIIKSTKPKIMKTVYPICLGVGFMLFLKDKYYMRG